MDYRADAEDPLAMFYQSGYLTIKGYNLRYREYELDYPNDEVKSGFITLVANGYFRGKSEPPENRVKQLDRMFRQGKLDAVREAFICQHS